MTGYIVKNVPGDTDRFHVYRGDERAPAFKAKTIDEAFNWIDADKAQRGPVDELELNGWPERDDSPRQQRIEQGGELAEVYGVLDRMEGEQRG
ncbi:hypothetical protein ACFSKY_22595 [Azotobacter chroococcum]|uniref:Uncharacterized protein n=1 Tax=Azotobacter chroococcum TaxID=353 RepID=A0A4R1P686_9GAMM|nr:hypothetical protein [Azotobacter chroococcum]TBV95294.1 hypothetical protein E0E53_13060 [Azotobacter chroococcum]TCL22076.1 hypothetical protein EV691_13525 [Azotobacter chroococcum]